MLIKFWDLFLRVLQGHSYPQRHAEFGGRPPTDLLNSAEFGGVEENNS